MKKYRALFYELKRNELGEETTVYKGSIEFFVFNDENPAATAYKRATIEQQNCNVCRLEDSNA